MFYRKKYLFIFKNLKFDHFIPPAKAPPVPKVDEEVENEDEASSPVEPRPLRYHGLQQLPHQHHGHLHHGHQDHQQQQQHQREKRGSSTPKRTHSFSSFSQLSTNSLPDIKELHPSTTVLTINGNRHHYHHHHHGHTGGHGGHQRGHQDTPDSVAPIGEKCCAISRNYCIILYCARCKNKNFVKSKFKKQRIMEYYTLNDNVTPFSFRSSF